MTITQAVEDFVLNEIEIEVVDKKTGVNIEFVTKKIDYYENELEELLKKFPDAKGKVRFVKRTLSFGDVFYGLVFEGRVERDYLSYK